MYMESMRNSQNYLDQTDEKLLVWASAQKEEHYQSKTKKRSYKA